MKAILITILVVTTYLTASAFAYEVSDNLANYANTTAKHLMNK